MPVFDHFADVVRLDPTDPRATVCGTCGAAWDDTVSTSVTPTPAGRCPFEYDHRDDDGEPIDGYCDICGVYTDDSGKFDDEGSWICVCCSAEQRTETDHQAQPDPVTMVEVVEFLQTISNAVNDWDNPDEDPDPWLIAQTMEKFAQEIWVRNQLAGQV